MGMTESVRWEGQKESFMSRRIAAIIGAHVAMGFSVVLMRFSLCGNDPFSCMNLGYASVSGLSYGACVIIFNLLLILPVLWLDRSYIRVGTLVNMFLLGIIADFWYAMLAPLAVFSEPSLLLRGLLLLSGVLLTCLACSFYMSSRLGMGPYDAIGWILAARTNGRMSFRTVRVLIDICAVTIGFACGSIVGLGTLVLACGTGPLIEFFNKKISQPLLYGRKI